MIAIGKDIPIFLLPCGVEDIEKSNFVVNNALFAV
jgi:hypothetical protein